jgi:predicted transglutaminase-like cysteine proteinase
MDMIRAALIGAFLLTLAGCAGKPLMTPGASVSPPSGAIDYCKRHPGDEQCK